MNKPTISVIVLYIGIALLSCAHAPVKPRPDVKDFQFTIPRDANGIYTRSDSARARNYKEEIARIKRIMVQYSAIKNAGDDTTEKKDDSLALWQAGIEKKLLRKGFIVSDEKTKSSGIDGISIDVDEHTNNDKPVPGTAFLIIDSIKIHKVKQEHSFCLDALSQSKHVYAYAYFRAEISGKVLTHANEILWSSQITATSFDFLKFKKKTDPLITIKAIRDYAYASEVKKWQPSTWQVERGTDNFQELYPENTEDFHKRELIDFVVSGFIDSLK